MVLSGIEYPDELIEMLQPGKSVRVYYGEGNPNNQKRYILAVIEDEQIVFKVWSQAKMEWRYRIVWIYSFLLKYRDGYLK